MAATKDDLQSRIRDLPDVEKLKLVDLILSALDRPDPELDCVWADEARKRWDAYKKGKLKAVGYREVMAKYRRS